MSDVPKEAYVVELTKLNLEPGEVLGVKVTSDNEIPNSSMDSLREKLQAIFPNNKVMTFLLPTGTNIEFAAIKTEEKVDCSVKTCDDCTCGKKELT